jgi:hypothetical protein
MRPERFCFGRKFDSTFISAKLFTVACGAALGFLAAG